VAQQNKVAVLGEGTEVTGDLVFGESLRIKGHYSGTISSEGILYLDENSVIQGTIKVAKIIIAGKVTGDIYATELIDVLETSEIKGNLQSPVIKIVEGVKIQGRCKMIMDEDNIDIFSTTVNQLKKSVSIV